MVGTNDGGSPRNRKSGDGILREGSPSPASLRADPPSEDDEVHETKQGARPQDPLLGSGPGHHLIAIPSEQSAVKVAKPVGYRWVVLGVFCLLTCSNAWSWVCFAPVPDVVDDMYGGGLFFINMLSMSYAMIYVVGGFPAAALFAYVGFRWYFLLSAFTNLAGTGLRFLATSPSTRIWLQVSQAVCGLAQTSILGTPPLLAGLWFPETERTTATAAGALFNNLGIALGLLLQPHLVQHRATIWASFSPAYILLVSFAGCVAILGVLFIRDGPPHPPSLTPSPPFELSSVWPAARKALSNKAFVCLSVGVGCFVGNFWALSALLAEFLCAFDMSDQSIGFMSFLATVVGIACTPITGFVMDRWRKQSPSSFGYRLPTLLFGGLSCASLGGFIAVLWWFPTSTLVLGVLYVVLGSALNCVMPVAMEYSVELTYPINEVVTGNLIMVMANVVCVGFIFLFTSLLNNGQRCPETAEQQQRTILSLGIVAGCFVLGTCLCVGSRGALRRMVLEMESEGNTQQSKQDRTTTSGTARATTRAMLQ